MNLCLEFCVAFFATAAFAVLFNVPKKQWIFAGITGGIGWIFYQIFLHLIGTVIATFVAVLVITLLSRSFAVIRKAPVTVFLISGIFPLVPGVGIYYTAYYFIMNNLSLAGEKGIETIKIAIAIALGIMFILSIPEKCFHFLHNKRVCNQ
ncbi:threonine/serine exporter family protein [Frisingicoccus sp.]|uniref:threonine/serine exporter family protein n=2 Tax=Frisingicoccus sp. TaxID=1918627 RepID=UPI003736A305